MLCDPALNLAFDYLSYLGTDKMSAEQIASEMYAIACSFGLSAGTNQSWIEISGLSENMGKAMEIVEGLIAGAQPNEEILQNLKGDMIKSRADAKLNQSRCFGALQRYMIYGSDFIRRTTLTDPALQGLTSEQLLAKIGDLMGKQHEVLYYGPQDEAEVKAALAAHHKVAADLQPLEKKFSTLQPTDENKVMLAQYDAKQLYYMQYSNRGEKFDLAADPQITLYNEYFGGGKPNIECIITGDKDGMTAQTNAFYLSRVIGNLLSNSAKFTESGTITLTCNIDKEKGQLVISVTDTGIGIPADKQEWVPKNFLIVFTFAGDSTITR